MMICKIKVDNILRQISLQNFQHVTFYFVFYFFFGFVISYVFSFHLLCIFLCLFFVFFCFVFIFVTLSLWHTPVSNNMLCIIWSLPFKPFLPSVLVFVFCIISAPEQVNNPSLKVCFGSEIIILDVAFACLAINKLTPDTEYYFDFRSNVLTSTSQYC